MCPTLVSPSLFLSVVVPPVEPSEDSLLPVTRMPAPVLALAPVHQGFGPTQIKQTAEEPLSEERIRLHTVT